MKKHNSVVDQFARVRYRQIDAMQDLALIGLLTILTREARWKAEDGEIRGRKCLNEADTVEINLRKFAAHWKLHGQTKLARMTLSRMLDELEKQGHISRVSGTGGIQIKLKKDTWLPPRGRWFGTGNATKSPKSSQKRAKIEPKTPQRSAETTKVGTGLSTGKTQRKRRSKSYVIFVDKTVYTQVGTGKFWSILNQNQGVNVILKSWIGTYIYRSIPTHVCKSAVIYSYLVTLTDGRRRSLEMRNLTDLARTLELSDLEGAFKQAREKFGPECTTIFQRLNLGSTLDRAVKDARANTQLQIKAFLEEWTETEKNKAAKGANPSAPSIDAQYEIVREAFLKKHKTEDAARKALQSVADPEMWATLREQPVTELLSRKWGLWRLWAKQKLALVSVS